MKMVFFFSIFLFSSLCFSQTISSSSCSQTDIGVENGNFATWQGFSGTAPVASTIWNPVSLPYVPPSPNSNMRIVPPPNTDPCATASPLPPSVFTLPSPWGGSFSIHLGDNNASCYAERITHSFVVQPPDTNFIYQYAIVLEDPGHAPQDQPYFEIVMFDQLNNIIPCSYLKITAGPSLPGFYSSATCPGTYWKPWTFAGVNLSPYIGQQVTVQCTNSDCALCGHSGDSYVDFTCQPLFSTNIFCDSLPDSILVCAPLDSGYIYSWSTGQTDTCIYVNTQIYDTVTVYIMPPSGCSFNMGYVFVPTIISAGFTYTISGNTVSFTDTTGITGGNLTGWSWSFPGGNPSSSALQNPSVTYSASGTYTVCLIATSAAGCKDTSCQSIFIPPSSVAGNNALSFLTLSPVPVSNELFLDFGINNFGEVKISFCNVLGKEIFSKIIPAKEKQMLDVSDFQTGIYFVKIQTDAGDAVKKIIISR